MVWANPAAGTCDAPAMCRWIAYFGNPIPPRVLLYDTPHGLVEQSRRDRLAGGYPNADGFGLGWYDDAGEPGLYRNLLPAWGDPNLRDIAAHLHSPLFLGHVRAATGTPVEQTNCHPFRHGRWLFQHNGYVERYLELRRDLLLAVDPSLFPGVDGTTDSQLMFFLALTFGLQEDPIGGLERMAGFVERTGHEHGIAEPLQMTVAASDGERVYAARYASGPVVNSLFMSEDARAIRALYPDDERFAMFSDESRVIVSEPLGDLPGVWREVAPGTALVVQPGEDEERPFAPH
jgi:predicted glutamine amidotransferase